MPGKIRRNMNRKSTGNEFVDKLMAMSDAKPLYAQNLLTTDIAAKIYPLEGNERIQDPIVALKLFNPTGDGTWYIWAIDPETGYMYGVTDLHGEQEMGLIALSEIRAYRGRFGLGIERDQHFQPKPLSQILKE